MRVLLIEDDATLGSAVRDHVAAAGHAVDWAQDLGAADDYLAVAAHQLILLDLGLPDGNGLHLLRRLRRDGNAAAVVILSARDQIATRIEALNSGADDYLTKPFDLAELTARMAAVARRTAGAANPERRFGALTLDSGRRKVAVRGTPVDLSAREWAVLDCLARSPGGIVAKTAIEDALYAFGAEVESNTVEVYVSRLRKKLGKEVIATTRGLGYHLVNLGG